MAHDKQYRDDIGTLIIERCDYPKKGELYWSRRTRRVEEATEDMDEKYMIIKRESVNGMGND